MKRLRSPLLSGLLLTALTSLLGAQANVDPTIKVKLGILGEISAEGRTGTFPEGMNAAAMSTTVCNEGGLVAWKRPMDPDHPMIAFLVARESNGRFQQISDRSHVKHGFFALTSSQCTTCTPPPIGLPGEYLGVGCSDTYSVSNNGNDFWLAPADEIDPWLGAWDPVCSFFDLGTGSVMVPDDCDGNRSFTQSQAGALGPVGNRIRLSDADLDVPGAAYWYQGQYVVAREAEAERTNNLSSRAFAPVWNGSSWSLNEFGAQLDGTILQRWTGAKIDSATNGGDDGRVYVAARVTGPVDGLYHYEFAVHNRDNFRGFSELEIPLCAGARVLNAGFSDVNDDALDDWTAAIESAGTKLVFRDGGANALRWNTIYNFWFDSDAAPAFAPLTLTQADPGAGAAAVSLSAQAPTVLYNVYTGAGCSLDGTPPTLWATGTPARATLGNATFGLTSGGNVPGQVNVLVATNALGAGAFPIGGCTFWLAGTLDDFYGYASAITDAGGLATYSVPVPASISLEGLTAGFQALGINPGGGGTFNVFDFSDGIEVRIGDSIPACD